MKTFKNRTAVITGAANGIGQALSFAIANKGCHLALVDKNEQALKDTAEAIQKKLSVDQLPTDLPLRITTHVTDVSCKDAMEKLASDVVAAHGGVNLLINNAGITINKTFAEHSAKDLELMVGVNLWGVIHGCRVFMPYLEQASEAHIVNTSSMVGFAGMPNQPSYCLTKAAVKALSETLMAECSGSHIKITCLHPGAIKTDIIRASSDLAADTEGTERMADLVDRFAMPVDKAADKIVRAIEKEKLRLLIGADAYILEFIKRLFPVMFHRLMGKAFQLKAKLSKAETSEA